MEISHIPFLPGFITRPNTVGFIRHEEERYFGYRKVIYANPEGRPSSVLVCVQLSTTWLHVVVLTPLRPKDGLKQIKRPMWTLGRLGSDVSDRYRRPLSGGCVLHVVKFADELPVPPTQGAGRKAPPRPGIPSAAHRRDLRKLIAARSQIYPPRTPGA